MKRLFLMLMIIALAAASGLSLSAQSRTVSGTVIYSGDKEPLIGASVIPVGAPAAAVATDINGKFTVTVPDKVTKLNVSYVGMVTEQVDVTKSPMVIELKNADNQLDEVVVTAFGVKRDRKGLGYAVQDLKAEDLNTAGTTSLSSALQGKLSGVDIRPSSGAPGASNNITIRGVRSFSGNNAPLYVVDGMPVASEPDFVNTPNSIVTDANVGDRSIDINPDDIESINVLKGQAAAALYGIRASNGVIVITTKRGSAMSSRPVVTISTDLSAERISRKFKHQEIYSQGVGGNYNPGASTSWGSKISELPNDPNYGGNTDNAYTQRDGKKPGMYYNPKRALAGLDGWTTPEIHDNVGDFFKTGFTENANFNISQRKNNIGYSFGLSNSYQKGIIPSTGMTRWGARGLVDWQIDNQWKTGFSANYSNTTIKSAPVANSGITNVVYGAPVEYDLKGIPNHVPGDPTTQISYRSTSFNNPYWWADNNEFGQRTQRFFGNAYVEFRPQLNWGENYDLTFREQIGIDSYTSHYNDTYELGSGSGGYPQGHVTNRGLTRSIFNNLFTANFNALFGTNQDFSLNVLLGNEVNQDNTTEWDYEGDGLSYYGQPVIGNCVNMSYWYQAPAKDRTVGLFFNANLSWRDMVFLSVTGRNDWVSSMPRDNRSFFYPSVSAAWVFTELNALKGNPILSFGKIRASYAEVGQAGAYYRDFAYTPAYGGGFYAGSPISYPLAGVTSYIPYYKQYDPDLKPQTTKNYELGFDFRLFHDRVRFDYTYSYQDVKNQIFDIPMAGSTGHEQLISNGGHITTNTHEFNLAATVYTSRDFTVDFGMNFTKYRSMVKELAPDVDNIFLGGFVEPQVRAYVGYAYPVIFGTAFARDDNGNLYLDANGLPVSSGDSQVIGDCTPDFNMGFNLSVRYKRVTLSSTWQWQNGGQMYSGTNLVMNGFGATEATADRENPITITGTNINTGEPMTAQVSMEDYWNAASEISEAAIYDTDYLKMRDLTLTYNLPKIGIFDISVYGFARNVLVWAKMPNLDPESSIGNNNAGGYFERFSIPNTSSFGGGLKVVF